MFLADFFSCPYVFEDSQELLSFKYKITRLMIIFLVIFSLGFSILNSFMVEGLHSYEQYARLFYGFLGLIFLFILRYKKNSFNFVTYGVVFSSLGFFSLILVSAEYDNFRMVWFIILTIAAFVINGTTLGLLTALFSSLILVSIHNIYDLGINNASMTTAVVSLWIVTLLLHFTTKKINAIENGLSLKNSSLKHLATHDPLTGIMNRRLFLEMSEKYLQNSRRKDENFYFLMLDIDHFKSINDKYGHRVGDKILIKYSTLIKSAMRENELFGRLGGEEFGIVILEKSHDEALNVAERIRILVEEHSCEVEGTVLSVTVSIGLALSNNSCSLEDVIHCADLAMYQAKSLGRNQVFFKEDIE